MNKCKNCGFWNNIESTDMGICRCLFAYEQRGYKPIQIVPFCDEKTREAETHMFFGCVHFEEKDKGPFSVEKHEAKTYNSWYISFCNQVAPTLFPIQKVAERWRDWLNELWAQKEKEPPGKNCFKKRECKTCAHWNFKRYAEFGFNPWGKCTKFGHGHTKGDACCRGWAQREQEPLDENCPDCTSFPCWTHQFFTGHARFCCDKFERRGLLNCGTYPNCGHNTCPCDKWSPKE